MQLWSGDNLRLKERKGDKATKRTTGGERKRRRLEGITQSHDLVVAPRFRLKSSDASLVSGMRL
jgi:hypothetical protein